MNLKKDNYSLLCSLGSLGRRLWSQHPQREVEKAGFRRRSWPLVPVQQQSQLTLQETLELNALWFWAKVSRTLYSCTDHSLTVGHPGRGRTLDKVLSEAGQSLKRLGAEVCLPTVLPAAGATESSLKGDWGATSQCPFQAICIYLKKIGKI